MSSRDFRIVDDETINLFFGKINAFLSLYDVCFVGGAFVFEDPDARLYNLLTYNVLNAGESYLCGQRTFRSDKVSIKQSKTHGIFLKTFRKAPCMPEVITNMLGCSDSRCRKFERLIDLDNICGYCTGIKDRRQHKGVILYYPFLFTFGRSGSYKKRYLYVKLESHPMMSLRHAEEAVKTYGFKSKTPERRESDPYTQQLQEKDIRFYTEMENNYGIGRSTRRAHIPLNSYDNSIRQGAEFFVSSELLDMFLTDFLNDEPINSVCVLRPREILAVPAAVPAAGEFEEETIDFMEEDPTEGNPPAGGSHRTYKYRAKRRSSKNNSRRKTKSKTKKRASKNNRRKSRAKRRY